MSELDDRWARNFGAAVARRQLKERAIAFLGGHCMICQYDRCPEALDFHHVEPEHKDFAISSRQSWETIVPELQKCALLCANCHREVHAGLHPRFLPPEEEGAGTLDFSRDYAYDG